VVTGAENDCGNEREHAETQLSMSESRIHYSRLTPVRAHFRSDRAAHINRLRHEYFAAIDGEDVRQVVNVGKDEREIGEPAGALQKIDAPAGKAGIRGLVPPPGGEHACSCVLWLIPVSQQCSADPGAASLIFLAELTVASGADNGDAGVTAREIVW